MVNTIDQIQREVAQRYDLKDSNTEIVLEEEEVLIITSSEMTLKELNDYLEKPDIKGSWYGMPN